MGKVESEIEINSGKSEIDIHKLSPGVYIIQTIDNNSIKFIKL